MRIMKRTPPLTRAAVQLIMVDSLSRRDTAALIERIGGVQTINRIYVTPTTGPEDFARALLLLRSLRSRSGDSLSVTIRGFVQRGVPQTAASRTETSAAGRALAALRRTTIQPLAGVGFYRVKELVIDPVLPERRS
jgi:hypothetical protein